MSTQHTPGPWSVTKFNEVMASNGALVASCYKLNGLANLKANTRLIAAAPDLLVALKLCEGNIDSLLASAHPRVFGGWLEAIRAAIAKAEGGAS